MPSNKRILIVDDSTEIASLMKRFYERTGFVVQTASNGQEALNILRTSTDLPAFILLDIMMPIMDGYSFREEQLNDPELSKIPTVLMTAFNVDQVKINNLRASSVLSKPVDLNKLEALSKTFCA